MHHPYNLFWPDFCWIVTPPPPTSAHTASVQAITVEVLNSSSIAVSWDPVSPLPGWDISYYQVDVTSFTTGTPSQHIHAHTERTTNGNETSAVVVSSDLLMVGGVDLVTEVRGVLDVGVDGVGLMEGEIAVMRTLLEPGLYQL